MPREWSHFSTIRTGADGLFGPPFLSSLGVTLCIAQNTSIAFLYHHVTTLWREPLNIKIKGKYLLVSFCSDKTLIADVKYIFYYYLALNLSTIHRFFPSGLGDFYRASDVATLRLPSDPRRLVTSCGV